MSDILKAQDLLKQIIVELEGMNNFVLHAQAAGHLISQALAALNVPDPVVTPNAGVWVWPTDFRSAILTYLSPYITQFFGNDPIRYSMFTPPGHEGLDIRTGGSGKILAAYDGVVYRAEQVIAAGGAYGRHVRLSHTLPDGRLIKTLYAHMISVAVLTGATVKAGEVLGMAGSTGNSSAVHLHFNIKDATDGKYLDPIEFMKDAYFAAGGTQALPAPLPPKV